jgi:hypothetical protein
MSITGSDAKQVMSDVEMIAGKNHYSAWQPQRHPYHTP